MKLSNRDSGWCRDYAKENGLIESEVCKAVTSYFDDIVLGVRKLPFANFRRIYTADAVASLAPVYNLPRIGRIGPIYSQYVQWRRECAQELDMVQRRAVRAKHLAERIEEATALALSGHNVNRDMLDDPIPSGLYHKVWLIDAQGRRTAAKQLFKKTKNK